MAVEGWLREAMDVGIFESGGEKSVAEGVFARGRSTSLSLGASDIRLAEKELPIQVCDLAGEGQHVTLEYQSLAGFLQRGGARVEQGVPRGWQHFLAPPRAPGWHDHLDRVHVDDVQIQEAEER